MDESTVHQVCVDPTEGALPNLKLAGEVWLRGSPMRDAQQGWVP